MQTESADFPEVEFVWWSDFPELEVDCRSCGRCCNSPGELKIIIPFIHGDLERMPHWVRNKYTEPVGYACYEQDRTMKMVLVDGHYVCAAFRGKIGGPCKCAIYPYRPFNCRAFSPGGHCLRFLEGLERAEKRRTEKLLCGAEKGE